MQKVHWTWADGEGYNFFQISECSISECVDIHEFLRTELVKTVRTINDMRKSIDHRIVPLIDIDKCSILAYELDSTQ